MAQIERDDLGGPKPVVRLEASAGWRGADLLAVIVDADADAHNRALLVYLVLHMHDRAAVRVEEISAEVAHRCAVGEDVGVEGGWHDHQREWVVGGRAGAGSLFDEGECLVLGELRRHVEVDLLIDRAEDRHGQPSVGELPGDAPAIHRYARVVLLKGFMDAPRKRDVGLL